MFWLVLERAYGVRQRALLQGRYVVGDVCLIVGFHNSLFGNCSAWCSMGNFRVFFRQPDRDYWRDVHLLNFRSWSNFWGICILDHYMNMFCHINSVCRYTFLIFLLWCLLLWLGIAGTRLLWNLTNIKKLEPAGGLLLWYFIPLSFFAIWIFVLLHLVIKYCPSCSSNSGYVCMVFYRREGHVVELQQSSKYLHILLTKAFYMSRSWWN